MISEISETNNALKNDQYFLEEQIFLLICLAYHAKSSFNVRNCEDR